MSETATIASSNSGGRPALDLADTVPFTRLTNIRLVAPSTIATTHESFLLSDKFIYSTSSTHAAAAAAAAVYHVSTRNTRSGKPWQLSISHLLPSEARRLSTITTTATNAAAAPFIKYDDDLTLYTGEKLSVSMSIGPTPLLCIRGRALPGTVVVEKTLGRRRMYKFWHMTPIRRPLTKAEEERMQAAMHRRGYRTSDDWRKTLLYAAQGREAGEMEWTDERGVVVARETEGRQLVVVVAGAEALDASAKDLLVACWASRNFVQSTPESEATAA